MADCLDALANMIYSGRGLIVGMTPAGYEYIGYSLTGRSGSSQARELKVGDNMTATRTKVTDRRQLEQGSPALLLYPALTHIMDVLIGSNGAQTGLIYSFASNLHHEGNVSPYSILWEAFARPFWMYDQKEDRWIDITTYEPDPPNNTPRISACIHHGRAALHIVRCGARDREQEIHHIELEPGKGKLMTTYKGGNENPLAPFTGEPLDVEIGSDSAEEIVESIYTAILGGQEPGDNYRVGAAVLLQEPRVVTLTMRTANRSERGS